MTMNLLVSAINNSYSRADPIKHEIRNSSLATFFQRLFHYGAITVSNMKEIRHRSLPFDNWKEMCIFLM